MCIFNFRDYIHIITLDTNLTYCIIVSSIENQKLLIGFVINNSQILGVIKLENFDYLLGVFILNNSMKTVQNLTICIVYVDKICFYSINPSEEIIDHEEILEISLTTSFITSYDYQGKYHVLCCQMDNNTYSFYDLSDKELYTQEHNISLPPELKPKKSLISSTISLYYSYTTDEKKKIAQNYHSSLEKHSPAQFYLQSIYDKLYFIIFSYENNKINLYSICFANNSFLKETCIDYQLHSYNSALQFVNNMLITYNFAHNEICVFDIQSDNDNHLLCYFNKMFDESQSIVIKGKNIQIIDSLYKPIAIYYVSFNNYQYYQMMKESVKYKALIDIMRHKKSFKFFNQYFNQNLIPQNKRCFFIHSIMTSIWKHNLTSNTKGDTNIKTEKIFKRQKTIVNLLSTLYSKANNAELIVIQLLIIYYNKLFLNGSNSVNFDTLLTEYLKQIPIETLVMFLPRNMLPNNEELLYFILSLNSYSGKHSKLITQTILDYMTKFKLQESVFALLYRNNKVGEALMYWNSIVSVSSKKITNTLKNIINNEPIIFANNKPIIIQFCSKDIH